MPARRGFLSDDELESRSDACAGSPRSVSDGRARRCALVCLLVLGCSADRRGGEPIAAVQSEEATPPASVDVSATSRRASRPRAPAPRPSATPPETASRELAPRANEEFGGALLAEVQDALSAVDENAFATLIHKDKRVTPDNCRSWRSLRTRGYAPKAGVNAQVDSGALVRCGSLEFLTRAKPSRSSYVGRVLDGAGPSNLPAIVASATSKLAARSRGIAANKAMTLAELLPGAHVGKSDLPGRVLIEDPASATTTILNAEAWGDVNSDEIEDVVISVLNFSDDGSYFDMRLIEATRASAGAPLTVLSVSM
jgi:hypothetical protein